MKDIKLRISHKNIKLRVQLYTYYTGEARKEIGIPERLAAQMQASDDDDMQLSAHIGIATAELYSLISRYFLCSHGEETADEMSNDKTYWFIISTPETFPGEVIPQMEKNMENYVAKRTLQQWFQQHRPEEAAIPAAEAQTHSYQLRELLTQRKRPVTETNNSNNPIDL